MRSLPACLKKVEIIHNLQPDIATCSHTSSIMVQIDMVELDSSVRLVGELSSKRWSPTISVMSFDHLFLSISFLISVFPPSLKI